MLKVEGLNVFYGAIQALDDVTIEVNEGEIVSIIGSNGAGKSTLLRTISGLNRPRGGDILFEGESIAGDTPDKIVARGISQSPEGRRIFTNMSVWENLQLGAHIRNDAAGIQEDMDRATKRFPRLATKRFPRLAERIKQNAGTLSGGEQQMVAMSRAMMSRPKLLLLDEPSMGLAPNLVTEIFRIITELNADGTTILLVEQNASRALDIAHRAYVLETGRVVLADTGKNLLANPKVKEAYLGG